MTAENTTTTTYKWLKGAASVESLTLALARHTATAQLRVRTYLDGQIRELVVVDNLNNDVRQ